MKFDIAAKLVTPTQRAWVVHAGRGRVNYPDFRDFEIVFLETPYLLLDGDIVKSKYKLRRSIRRSVAWRQYFETTGSQAPSEVLSDYSSGTFSDSGLQTLSGSIHRIYGVARKGDLVVVPGSEILDGVAQPVIRFGEITSDFDPSETHSGRRLSSQKVPVRRVRWLKVVPRKSISFRLDKRIGKPPAVREVKINRENEELLKHAYDSYIFESNSSSLVTANRYDASDFVLLNQSSELIAFLVSAHAALTTNANHLDISDVRAFTERYYQDAAVENIEVDFASPGHWRIMGATVSLAVFVSLGVAVFSSGISADDLKGGIEVTNSASPDDATAEDLERSMNILLGSMDKLELQKTVDTATKGKRVIGLQSATKPVD